MILLAVCNGFILGIGVYTFILTWTNYKPKFKTVVPICTTVILACIIAFFYFPSEYLLTIVLTLSTTLLLISIFLHYKIDE